MSNALNRNLRKLLLLVAATAPTVATAMPARAAEQGGGVRVIEIVVDGGYKPSAISVQQGERVRLRFLRKDWSGCTREVLIPALKIRRDLPTNKAVEVDLPTVETGEYEFRCGMNMVRGTITVAAR